MGFFVSPKMQKAIEGGYGSVPKSVMVYPKLSIGAKALYSLLLTYADRQKECFPQAQTMMDNLQVSRKSIFSYLKELEDSKLLRRSKKFPGTLNSTNNYELFYPDPENDPDFFNYNKSNESVKSTTPSVTVELLPVLPNDYSPEYPEDYAKNTNNKNTNLTKHATHAQRHTPASHGEKPSTGYSKLTPQKALSNTHTFHNWILSKFKEYPEMDKEGFYSCITKAFKWLIRNPREDEFLFLDTWITNAISRKELIVKGYKDLTTPADLKIFIEQTVTYFAPEEDGLNDLNP